MLLAWAVAIARRRGLLLQMGARIEGIGSNVLIDHGQDQLGGADYTNGPDSIEIGSFVTLAGLEWRIQGDDNRNTFWCPKCQR